VANRASAGTSCRLDSLANPRKEEEGPRAGVENVARVAGVLVDRALEGADLTFEEAANHFTSPFSKRTLAATPAKRQGRLER
jgi:hypothetical protein